MSGQTPHSDEATLASVTRIELSPIQAAHKIRSQVSDEIETPARGTSAVSGLTELMSSVPTPATTRTTTLASGPPSAVILVNQEEREPKKTPEQARRRKLYLAALFWTLILNGWNDGSNGPLIPRMQSNYHVGFAVVSLIFIVNCVGFMLGAISNVWLTDHLGFGKVMAIGATSQCITYAIQSPAPPFPVFVLSYLFSGFGISLQNAGANAFITGLPGNSGTKLGFLHAFYGVGAFVSPLAATHFSNTKHWTFHFLISTGLGLTNLLSVIVIFRFKKQEELYVASGDYRQQAETAIETGKYAQILRLRAVHLLAAFAFLYIGTEVTLGGWIVTYIINVRHGGSSSGYISSGFFGGLAVGRISLLWLNKKIGPRRVIYVYTAVNIALQITIWLVPSLIQNAIAISIVGVLLGPMFPIIVNETKSLLPMWLLSGSIGWITAVGMAGSAALPFFTGLLASRFGIKSLQPLVVSMMGAMICIWALVPKSRRVE